jgi:hypothetical protein
MPMPPPIPEEMPVPELPAPAPEQLPAQQPPLAPDPPAHRQNPLRSSCFTGSLNEKSFVKYHNVIPPPPPSESSEDIRDGDADPVDAVEQGLQYVFTSQVSRMTI